MLFLLKKNVKFVINLKIHFLFECPIFFSNLRLSFFSGTINSIEQVCLNWLNCLKQIKQSIKRFSNVYL